MAEPVKGLYWFADAGFPLGNVDPSLSTHVYCAFATINSDDGNITAPPDADNFTRVLQQKKYSVKTLLSIGGGYSLGVQDARFTVMAANPVTRANFVASCIKVARQHSFDGLDLDYEFPPTDPAMANFGVLLGELRKAITADAVARNGIPPLLFTAAVYFNPTTYQNASYPTAKIASHLDWINVMSYDLFVVPNRVPVNDESVVTNPAAPLYGDFKKTGSDGIDSWIQAGVIPKKIVFGIPFFGRAWRPIDPSNHGYGAPAQRPNNNANSVVLYKEIRNLLADPEWRSVRDDTSKQNYCYKGDQWISYDDEGTIKAKVEFIKEKGLLGYFAWRAGGDDANLTLTKAAFNAL